MAKADYYVPDDRPWFKYYPKDVPHHLDYPEVPLYQFLDDSAKKYPEKTALVFYDKEITYKELKELTDRFAHALQNFGIQKGDRAFFLLPNCPQFVIAFYGTMKAGAIPVPFNPLYSVEELKYFFRDAEPRIVLTLDTFYDKVKEAAKVTPQIEKIIVTNIADYFPSSKKILGKLFGKIPSPKCEGASKFQEFIDISPNYNEVKVNPKEDISCLMYTGGTTGKPEGVPLTHFNIVANNLQFYNWLKKDLRKEEQDILLALTPFFAVHGLSTCLSFGILIGAKLIIFLRFHTESVLRAIDRYRITCFWGVPTMFNAMKQKLEEFPKKYKLTSLKVVGYGASPCPQEIFDYWRKKLYPVEIRTGYGLTESSALSHQAIFPKTKEDIGLPLPDTDCKIIDPETEKELEFNQPGELWLRGPQITNGYWQRLDLNQEFFKDGWLKTRDILKIDEKGYFYYMSREDDVINHKGYKIYPREVENVLEEHPAVEEAVVFGIPTPHAIEVVKAIVIPKKGVNIDKEELQNFCKDKLIDYKIPKVIEFQSQIPRSKMGKPLKYKLRSEVKNKQ